MSWLNNGVIQALKEQGQLDENIGNIEKFYTNDDLPAFVKKSIRPNVKKGKQTPMTQTSQQTVQPHVSTEKLGSWETNEYLPEIITKSDESVIPKAQTPVTLTPEQIIQKRLSTEVPIQNPQIREAGVALAKSHTDFIASLPSFSIYTLKQTIHHGDKLCNYFLRGSDTIDLYNNMYIKEIRQGLKDYFYNLKKGNFYFLPLFYLDYPNDKEKNHYDCLTLEELFKLYDPIDFYQKELRIIIEKEVDDNNLKYFQNLTWEYIQDHLKLIKSFPKANNYFVTYRGVQEDFIQNFTNPKKCYYFNSYQSTSVMYKIAANFAKEHPNGTICTFWIHPSCEYVYLESISIYHEFEVLLAPGHRAVFLYKSNTNDNYHFMILPPDEKSDLLKTENIDDHIKTQIRNARNININESIYQRNVNESSPPNNTKGGFSITKSSTRYRRKSKNKNKNKTRKYKSKKQKGGDPNNSITSDIDVTDLVTETDITKAQAKERERLLKMISSF